MGHCTTAAVAGPTAEEVHQLAVAVHCLETEGRRVVRLGNNTGFDRSPTPFHFPPQHQL